ncbi:hypothetical protein [Mangrovibacterium marinum]|uniref:hypothetical protein n=1 Tax=Mangrovibacterium marinum TaxID=1639118 RepID=UPI0011B27382|nr:hypothetical protein [Mangrovibacterium marinum]
MLPLFCVFSQIENGIETQILVISRLLLEHATNVDGLLRVPATKSHEDCALNVSVLNVILLKWSKYSVWVHYLWIHMSLQQMLMARCRLVGGL